MRRISRKSAARSAAEGSLTPPPNDVSDRADGRRGSARLVACRAVAERRRMEADAILGHGASRDASRQGGGPAFDRGSAIHRYFRNRAHTRALFDLLDDEAYYSRPIALRHPFVFYEG